MTEAQLNAIEVISFDLDDTLWHCAPAITHAEEALFEWHKIATPKVTRVHTMESLLAYRSQMQAARPELLGCVTAMRIAGLKALLADFGYPEELATEGFAVFYNARSEVDLYDGVLEMLATLKQHYRLAAITNGNADLHRIGIAGYFEQIYAADLTLAPKPEPAMFQQCLRDLDIPACALLHIGDNPATDIGGGHNAGVQTLWFNPYNDAWPDHLSAPHFEVQALSDITALLQEK